MRTRNNNSVKITGYVGKDPELKEGKNTIAKFSVGIPMGKETTTWVYITAWHDDARMVMDLVKKGTEVIVYGELNVYQGENGTFTSINATGVRPLVKIDWSKYKKESEEAPPAFDIPDTDFKDDDLPF